MVSREVVTKRSDSVLFEPNQKIDPLIKKKLHLSFNNGRRNRHWNANRKQPATRIV